MAYRLHPDEVPGAGLLRAVVEQLDEAIAHLTARGPAPLGAEAVHEARKCMKRVRSGLRLARAAVPDEFREWNRAVAGAARQLAPWRDADAMLEAFAALIERVCEGEEVAPPLFARTRAALTALRDAGGGGLDAAAPPLRQAVKALRRVRARLAALDAARVDDEALARGLGKIRRSCRKAMRASLARPDAELFHEWRKQTKHFWYAAVLLSEIWPAAADGLQADLKELAQLLGEDHDLVILRAWATAQGVDAPFDSPEEQIAFVMLLDSIQAELRDEAAVLGRRVVKARRKGLRKALARCRAAAEKPCPAPRRSRAPRSTAAADGRQSPGAPGELGQQRSAAGSCDLRTRSCRRHTLRR